MGKRKLSLNLYQKFFFTFILIGIIPISLVATIIMNRFFSEYESALLDSYTQSIEYASATIETMLDSYDEIVKIPYYYSINDQTSYSYSYDYVYSIKKILEGTISSDKTEKEAKRIKINSMKAFTRYVFYMDPYIKSAYFIDCEDNLYSHSDMSYTSDENKLRNASYMEKLDKSSKDMMIFTGGSDSSLSSKNTHVFTIARNYFDVSGAVGGSKYMGTLFIHVDILALEKVFSSMEAYKKGSIYISDANNYSIFSNNTHLIGQQIDTEIEKMRYNIEDSVVISKNIRDKWTVYFHLTYQAVFERLRKIQQLMFVIIGISVAALVVSSIGFSKGLTKPIRNLMEQMSQIETGNFQIEIPVTSDDELGILSKRFNQMAKELNTYINKFYIAQIKQTEAELTSLKSQIYPHFLYNTLEVIRMTAVDYDNMIVSEMIEALSDQIRYIIGPVKDIVPLEMEIDIIKKYVFLLNCRTQGKINLIVHLNGLSKFQVPKLILQPIIENAYIHGIKPKDEVGNIMITAEVVNKTMEISLMDNGVGMDKKGLVGITELLNSNEIGIKNEHNWQSIGLKNVHDRIRYLYGEDYGIHVTSTLGVGTLIRIIIPYYN